MHYGATPDEWAIWSDIFGMTPDLLPVVCKPGEPLYAHSNLNDYGKVPSRYTRSREVVGFTNWTSYTAQDSDVLHWGTEGNYGICLQTRQLRALDFDILDQNFADSLRQGLELLGYEFPWRTRANSSKFLTLFYLEGEYGKQTLSTPHGIIEFLANGQQCLVAGTHPSGARYTWDWHHPFPRLSAAEWGELQAYLVGLAADAGAGWSAPSRSRVTDRHESIGPVDDPVVDFLRSAGLVASETRDGRIFLTCPWADRHTTESDRTASCWFAAGTNGYETGHYRCLHGHCAGRKDWEFLREVGYDTEGFEVEGPAATWEDTTHPSIALAQRRGWNDCDRLDSRGDAGGSGGDVDSTTQRIQALSNTRHQRGADHTRDAAERQEPIGEQDSYESLPTISALGADRAPANNHTVSDGQSHPLDLPRFERDSKGTIKPTIGNVVDALLRPDLSGFVIAKDTFKNELMMHPWPLGKLWTPEMKIWTSPKRQELSDHHYADLHITLRKLGVGPGAIGSDVMRLALLKVAADRTFDSAINWAHTLPNWDGVERIDTFIHRYLGGEDSPYTRAVGRYWWTAHAGRVLKPGCQADMAIVMISQQGTGKTSTLKAIAPFPEYYVEINMTHRDDDLSRSLEGKVIGEMAELNGVRGREVESVKAFISRTKESWVPKYREHPISFPRRLVLVGTSNEEEFLVDQTGNRRWLPVRMGKQQVDQVVHDRDQLWAEAMALYTMEGVLWNQAESLARGSHLDFTVSDEWESMIYEWLVTDDGFGGGPPCDREELRMNDVLRGAIGLSSSGINHVNQLRGGRALRKFGYEKFNVMKDCVQMKVWKKGKWEWNQRHVKKIT